MKKNFKWIILIVVLLAIVFLADKAATSSIAITSDNVHVTENYIVFEIELDSSIGMVKDVELETVVEGVYEVNVSISKLFGHPSPYVYPIDNRDGHIKEIRQYDLKDNQKYEVIYKND